MLIEMLRRAAFLTIVVLTVGLTPTASGSSERSMPIRLGVGIGPINLGMTGQQVRRAFGTPWAVAERRLVRGQPYIELQWSYGAWNVGLVGRKGHRRVVLVGTTVERHRTPQGLGIGSTEREIAQQLPGSKERLCGFARSHWYYRRGRTETVFHPPHMYGRGAVYVEVRAPPTVGCAF